MAAPTATRPSAAVDRATPLLQWASRQSSQVFVPGSGPIPWQFSLSSAALCTENAKMPDHAGKR